MSNNPPFEEVREIIDRYCLDQPTGEDFCTALDTIRRWLDSCGENRPSEYLAEYVKECQERFTLTFDSAKCFERLGVRQPLQQARASTEDLFNRLAIKGRRR